MLMNKIMMTHNYTKYIEPQRTEKIVNYELGNFKGLVLHYASIDGSTTIYNAKKRKISVQISVICMNYRKYSYV